MSAVKKLKYYLDAPEVSSSFQLKVTAGETGLCLTRTRPDRSHALRAAGSEGVSLSGAQNWRIIPTVLDRRLQSGVSTTVSVDVPRPSQHLLDRTNEPNIWDELYEEHGTHLHCLANRNC